MTPLTPFQHPASNENRPRAVTRNANVSRKPLNDNNYSRSDVGIAVHNAYVFKPAKLLRHDLGESRVSSSTEAGRSREQLAPPG
jgi:hypothetical protein